MNGSMVFLTQPESLTLLFTAFFFTCFWSEMSNNTILLDSIWIFPYISCFLKFPYCLVGFWKHGFLGHQMYLRKWFPVVWYMHWTFDSPIIYKLLLLITVTICAMNIFSHFLYSRDCYSKFVLHLFFLEVQEHTLNNSSQTSLDPFWSKQLKH